MISSDTLRDLNVEFGKAEAQFNKICALKPHVAELKSKVKEKLPKEISPKAFSEEQLAQTIDSIKAAKKDLLANITTIKAYADKIKDSKDPGEIAKINQRLASLQRLEKAASRTLKSLLSEPLSKSEKKKDLVNEALDFEKDVGSALKKARRSAFIKPDDFAVREKAFIDQMTSRNIAQLVGDAYIKELADSNGNKLEGADFEDILGFLIAAMKYLPAECPDEFPTDQTQKFEEIVKQLQASQLLKKQINNLYKNADQPEFTKKLSTLSENITQSIQSLKPGESMLLPWGWNVKNGVGHAMLAEFRKDGQDVLIKVYNTGSGLEDHEPGDKNGKPYANTIKNFSVPLGDLKKENIISRMLEPATVSGSVEVMKEGDPYQARELYFILDPYALPSQAHESNWMKNQMSGTCALRSVMAFLNYRIGGDNYKTFKSLLERKAVQTILDKGPAQLDKDPKVFRMLVARTNANLFRQELKRGEEQVGLDTAKIDELKKLEKKYKKAFRKTVSKNQPVSSEIVKAIPVDLTEDLPKLSRFFQADDYKPINLIPPTSWINNYNLSPAELSSAFKGLCDYCLSEGKIRELEKVQNLKFEKYNSLFVNALIHLGRIFANPSLSQEKAKFIAALRQSGAQVCGDLIDNIEKINNLLVEFRPGNQAQSLALASSSIAIYQIGIILDDLAGYKGEQRLDNYSFAIPDLHGIKDIEHPGAQLLNAQWDEDFKNLINYHKDLFKDRTNDICEIQRSFNAHERGFLIPKKDSADYRYWSAQAKLRKDWTDADKLLEMHRKDYYGTREHFRTLWAFRQYPKQYQALLNSINRTYQVSNFGTRFVGSGLADNPFSTDKFNIKFQNNDVILEYIDAITSIEHPEVEFESRFENKIKKEWDQPHAVKKLAIEMLKPKEQNQVVSKYDRTMHEAMSIVSENTPLRYSMLIDYFRKSYNIMLQPENQLFFSSVLFAPMRLSDALKKNPGLKKEVLEYFNSASEYFLQPSLPITSKERALVDAFLTSMKQRFISVLRQINDPEGDKLMKDARNEILEMFESDTYKDQEAQLILKLSFMESFTGDKAITKDDAISLVQSAVMVNKYELMGTPRSIMRNDFKASALAALRSHINTIQKHIQTDPGKILSPLLKEYGLDPEAYKNWSTEKFPILSNQGPEGLVEVDVLAGTLKLNGSDILFSKVSDSMMETKEYTRLFGTARLDIVKAKDYVNTQDKLSPIRIIDKSWKEQRIVCYRQWDKKEKDWYEYKPIEKAPLLSKLPFARDMDVWVNTNEKAKIKARIYNNQTNKLEYLVHFDGTITISSQGNKRFQLLDAQQMPELESLKLISPEILVFKEKDTGNVMMMLPKNINEHGEPIIFDQKTVFTEKKQKEIKWVSRDDPDFWISSNQQMKGIENYKCFLVLENDEGRNIALLPRVSYTAKSNINSYINEITTLRMQLKNFHLESQNTTEKTLYAAFVHLSMAATPEDYLRVLDLLESIREYRRFNDNELKMLGWLYDLSSGSPSPRPDYTPESFALRLYVLSIVRDNFANYPQLDVKRQEYDLKKHFEADVSADSFERVWNGLVTIPLSTEGATSNEQSVSVNFKEYLARRNNMPRRLLLENLISPQKLKDWDYDGAVQHVQQRNAQVTNKPAATFDYDYEVLEKIFPDQMRTKKPTIDESLKNIPIMRTRRANSTGDFNYLYTLATSSDKKHRDLVKEILHQRVHDSSKSRTYDAILLLALMKNDASSEYATGAGKVLDYFLKAGKEDLQLDNKTFREKIIPEFNHVLSLYNRGYVKSLKELTSKTVLKALPITPLEKAVPPSKLPDKPPSAEFHYRPAEGLFENFKKLHADYFKELPMPQEQIETSFQLKNQEKAGSFIRNTIEALNQDYAAGKKANLKTQCVAPIKDPKETATQLVAKEMPELERLHKKDKKTLDEKGKEIEKIANKRLRKDPALRTQIGGQKRDTVTLDDCLLLFLQKDSRTIEKLTGIQNYKDQNKLYQMIGEYLELSAQTIQQAKVLSEMNKVQDSLNKGELLDESLKNLANVLSQTHLGQSVNPEAILVFENKIGLILRDYQVEGLNEMLGHPNNDPMKYADVFLQRIQAGGKTLVWGHLLAHLKADGYHLSLHVSPTHQYASNLYDMGDRSKYVFSQKEHTMIFDDSPEYYKPEYLEATLKTLKEGILNREYINTTKKSLDTLLAQYDHFCLGLTPQERDIWTDTEKAVPIMQEILALLRSRGVFTFDEVHQALEPTHILNIPIGSPTHPDRLQCKLSSQMLMLAVESKDAKGKALLQLKENKQSQQTEAEKEEMKLSVARNLCSVPEWQEIFGIRTGNNVDEKRKSEIQDYLLNPQKDLPAFLNELKEKPENLNRLVATDYVILARQILAGGWLALALSKGVNEFHGINKQPNALPVSIPFVANMVPAYGSEFSDQFVKIINTQIAYLVDGPSLDQAKNFIQRLKQQAVAEYQIEIQSNPSFNAHETHSFKIYQEFCKTEGIAKEFRDAEIPYHLFEIDVNDQKAMKIIQEALRGESPIAMEMLLDFVNDEVISKVDIFNHQVSIHGQNTACMAKHINGYTASIDNPNMAPVMEAALDGKGNLARRVKIQPQLGTNGQTIDLLMRQNNEAWIIPSDPNSIFTHLINKLPDSRRKLVRAIFDEGCHFRGIGNHAVAKMILKNLPDPNIKAILFFDQATGKLCYIRKESPERVIPLKGTKSISEETRLEPKELFSYYDQEHITGTDIPQMDMAIAVSTINESSRLPNELQQVRRLRKLDFFQRTITALQVGSLDKISQALDDPAIGKMKVGKVDSPEFIKQLILFTHLNEAAKEQTDNLEFCAQQMESIVQQYLRDGIYTGKLDRSTVYRKAKDLFRKNIAINLYKEHAKTKVNIPNNKFFEVVREGLLALAKDALPEGDIEKLRAVLKALEQTALKGIQEKVEVSPDFGAETKVVKTNRNAVVLQRQINIQKDINVNINIQKNINIQLNPNANPKEESLWTSEVFKKPATDNQTVKFLSLQTELTRENISGNFLDPRIQITDNFYRSVHGEDRDMVNQRRKPIMQVGLMQNEKGEWNVIMGSVKDMWKYSELINTSGVLPEGKKAWLIRPQGHLAWPGPFPYDEQEMLKNDEVRRLLVQTLLFSGNMTELNTPFWSEALKEWLKELSPDQRKELRQFVDKIVFLDKPPKNFASTLVGQIIAQ